jgi:hypothetical protein
VKFLAAATLLIWLISIWLGASAFRSRGLVRRLQRLLAAAAFAGLGALLGALLFALQLFHAFSGETLIARVTTRRLSPGEFELTYTPVRAPSASGRSPTAGGDAMMTHIRLRGDQWSISGGIVKWHPWLSAFGLTTYHKPMRLGGQFSNLEQQRSHRPTVYALEPGADRFWEALYWADPYLPFVEAVYGSSAYVYVEPGVIQEVYVTPSGYMIKR